MTILPSPIPHPLNYCPFDVPGWAYEALEWVVGFDWPEGDEKATWDVADRWYAIADRLTAPRDEAFDAAGRVIAGYGGAGVTAQAFIGAWDRVAVEDRAPLTSLLDIADELGKLVEECGCDIEGAKLEAWIEIGLFLTELIGMAVATAVTLGAASPAAGGLIAATRIAIQRIFQRLAEQLGQKAIKKTLKEAGERAATQLTTRDGLRRLGREALGEGLDEMREEAATNAGIQLYQNSTGRADGIDGKDLGISAAGGFAGGVAASGAGVGRRSHTGLVRGMGAEVVGEFGGAAVSGDLPDLEGVAKAASSGAATSGVTNLSVSGLDVSGLSVGPLDAGNPGASASSSTSSSPVHSETPLPSAPSGSPGSSPALTESDNEPPTPGGRPPGTESTPPLLPSQDPPAATPPPPGALREVGPDPRDAALTGLGNPQQPGPVYYSSAYAGPGPEPPPPPEPERPPGPDPAPPPTPARPEPRIPAPRRPIDHGAEALPPVLPDVAPPAQRDGTLPLDPRDTHEQNRRDEHADYLTRHRGQAAGAPLSPRIEADLPDWVRRNDGRGTLARAGVETGDESALTGDDDPPPIDRSRPYGKRGGLRPPLAVHQEDLERAMPRQADGRVHRLADPREGTWFALANDGGPAADPTRAINCVDGVLSLFDTYIHGRPRVAAPRTFDAYAEGEPTRPLGAEEAGLARIEKTVGGEFQGLCPYVGSLPAEQAKSAVDQAMTNLHNHVYNAGHGAFAFVVTEAEQGTAHAWTAVNQNGTVLFLDPQTGDLAEGTPLYGHLGIPAPDNIVSMDALVVDNTGKPSPLPWHEPGLWSRSNLEPTGADGLGLRPAAGVAPAAERQGQTPGPLGSSFALGAHYLDLFPYAHTRRQAERLGDSYDVRALNTLHGPDVILRSDSTDAGSYGDLKWLDPDEPAAQNDSDSSRRVENRLRQPFTEDARIAVAVVDGRDVGLTIDGAVRGIRRALTFWRRQGRELRPDQRMIVFTGDGGAVMWRGDTGTISVSV